MKKLLVIVLAICMVMMSVVPAFAAQTDAVVTQSTPDQVAPTSNAQIFYNAYNELAAALNSGDIDVLKAASDNYTATMDGIEEFTDEEIAELETLFGKDIFEVLVDLLVVAFDVDIVLSVDEVYNAYLADPNVKTAYDFVAIYSDSEYVDEEAKALLKTFFADIDEVYAKAEEDLPTAKVSNLYAAYTDMMDALDWYDLSEVETATAAFLEAYNESLDMTDDEQQQLALMMGLSSEEAIGVMVSDYITACTLVQVGKTYDAFWENPCADTAQDFVDLYNGIYNDSNYKNENLESLISDYFFDFEETYEEALAILADDEDSELSAGSEKEPQQSADSQKTDESVKVNAAPVNTGSTTNAAVVLATVFTLLVGVGIFRKKVK